MIFFTKRWKCNNSTYITDSFPLLYWVIILHITLAAIWWSMPFLFSGDWPIPDKNTLLNVLLSYNWQIKQKSSFWWTENMNTQLNLFYSIFQNKMIEKLNIIPVKKLNNYCREDFWSEFTLKKYPTYSGWSFTYSNIDFWHIVYVDWKNNND
jgi:hypothetical protein